jgi:hypothetical protein
MKTIAIALAAASLAAPALAQDHSAHAHAAATTGVEAPAGALSVETTLIGDILKNEKAKAALEAALPAITQYYDQISTMSLSQVAPMSQGAIDDAKLKEIQAEFDKLK